jgi:hypothetical protein
LEEAAELFWCHANACVCDPKHNLLRARGSLCLQSNRPFFGELGRVGEQIEERLADLDLVYTPEREAGHGSIDNASVSGVC